MTKDRTELRCSECGAGSACWVGRCPGCGAWSTMVEERVGPRAARRGSGPGGPAWLGAAASEPVLIGHVGRSATLVRPTGVHEVDRVLGGGLVAGSATLLGGEPGTGKSTLLLQVLARMAAAGSRCLLVSAEESAQQVALRAERLEAVASDLWLLAETDLHRVMGHLDSLRPAVVVVDSVQTVFDPDLSSAPGSVAQVRECAHRLVRLAKERGVVLVLVGHVTKDGSLAGPRVLEHLVDTVLSFSGDRHHALRLLRATKHRFGPTGELGLFEMGEAGLTAVVDPGGLFLSDRRDRVAGSVVVPAVEGKRPLLVELQALVVPVPPGVTTRRSAQGLDAGRLGMLLAVLDRRAGVALPAVDVFTLAVGGVKVVEPAADLGLALAVASSWAGTPVPPELVACGEVGLAGELRQVGHTSARLAEAARLGFRLALLPESAPAPPPGMTALRVGTLAAALDAAGLSGGLADRRHERRRSSALAQP